MESTLRIALIALISILFVGLSNGLAQDAPPDQKVLDMIEQELYDEAKAEINKRMQANAKDPAPYYLKGILNLALENYTGAKETFQAGIKARSKYAYNHIGLARAYNKLGMAEDRDNSIAQAIKVNKKEDVNIALGLVKAYLEADKLEDAKVLLYQLREAYPDDPRPWFMLGEYYTTKGGVDELAQPNFEKALEIDDSFITAYFELARIYIRQKEYQKGLEYLNTAIEKNPEFAPAYRERGELWLKAGEYEKARSNYEKYVSMLPNDVRAQLRFASFLYLTGKYDACLKTLGSLDTFTLVSQRLTGYCHMETGQYDKAQAEMDKYFSMAPAEKILAEDYEALGKMYQKMGDDKKAVENYTTMFARAIERKSKEERFEDPKAFYEKIAIKYKKAKDYPRESFYRQTVVDNADPVSSKDYYNLGVAARKSSDYATAQMAFGQVAELAPDYVPGQFWYGYATTQIAQSDSTSEAAKAIYPGLEQYQKVWELLAEKPEEDLTNSDKYYLGNTGLYLVMHAFDPNKDENYNCAATEPFIEKITSLDPNITSRDEGSALKQIMEYCEAVKAQGGK